MEPERIADYECVCGEGPLWHPDEKRLYWVDIPKGRLFRYDPASGAHEMCFEGDELGGFTIQADGALLLFMARGAVKTWRDGTFATVIEEIPDERGSRFNDVIADQPVWFSDFKQLMDNAGRGIGPLNRTDLGVYPSVTKRRNNFVLWHPDRKFFLVGKRITDEWLSSVTVPEGEALATVLSRMGQRRHRCDRENSATAIP